jgi:oligoribonuclease NrnB/cAMP/cGMP phosphodiesterase (DHH superfamily)
MSKVYILFHANCMDGTGAKFAAWKKFGEGAEYIPVQYGKPLPEMEPGSRVFIVDFSYPKEVLEQLRSVHQELVVLDHHKTAEEALKGFPGCYFDMTKSGAVMAWEYFHPGTEIPRLLEHVQDRDLWKWELDDTAEIHMGLQMLKGDVKKWDVICKKSNAFSMLVDSGKVLLKKQTMTVENAVKNHTKIIDFMGYKVGVTNQSDHASEVGSAICTLEGVDFGIVYCITRDNEVLLSLRSVGNFDTSVIAKHFGGGGHANASGCRLKLEDLPKFLKGEM